MTSAPVICRRPVLAAPLADMHPVVARVLAARGITHADELDVALAELPRPRLADVEAAVARLAQARAAAEKILLVGDFDADGATSVALALRGLRALGYGAVEYLVPNRFDYGYGLTPELVELAAERQPDLIVTVDNGVSSHAGVAAAAARGIDTIVTDHHLPGADLPQAVAVVNPNREDCPFPCKELAGVGVVFYLLIALRAHLSEQGNLDPAPSIAGLLDLVALGTVADLVKLDRTNRILVEQGLRRIRAGQAAPGILALLGIARREPATVSAGDLGYAVAPRLNAAGRLADMTLGIETLLADTPEDAHAAATRLDELNTERRRIEGEMRAQADTELDRLRAPFEERTLPAGIVLHDERWHEGVIGILAGRVREAVHRPAVVFADAEEPGMLKGSARSVPGLHVRDVLARIAAAQPELLQRFGGHAMAAGLQLAADQLPVFRKAFIREVELVVGDGTPVHEVQTDGVLEDAELSLATAEALRLAGPWGPGFPEPVFDGEFDVRKAWTVGERHLKLKLVPVDGGAPVEAIAFNADAALHDDPGARVRLVYRLDVNEYRGRRSALLVIEHLERIGRDMKEQASG
ncbi:MAG: single-stranded-DNA-specific exonuclease RecJ [Halofilum sp. (in: g-proteobacteria)]